MGANDTQPKDRPANQRGVARLAAAQALYQLELTRAPVNDVIAEFELFRLKQEIEGANWRDIDFAWFKELVSGVVENQREIDPKVNEALAAEWPLKRVDATLRAILRSGVYELLKRKDVPARVAISEYVEVAKAFFDDDEPRIVNGVLDRIGRDLRSGELAGRQRPVVE
ncbi:transcription antitermination factor NusB [Amorphus orientalis]|uniref:Transcription antitermination protein NusB n=1 Tax=Amorphus orientalis TaxID=649198 RepID=A0AAE3VQK7_9HYPH|nr:transcription antitermination factor NusB [Amorphus orientalis]MDQ0316045.1 N utilization substance protein B [Amorphus orientalis]